MNKSLFMRLATALQKQTIIDNKRETQLEEVFQGSYIMIDYELMSAVFDIIQTELNIEENDQAIDKLYDLVYNAKTTKEEFEQYYDSLKGE